MTKSNVDLSMLSSIEDERYISLKDCLKDIDLDKYEIPICLGRDSDKNIVFKDFVDIKNILMSGMTHSGKSVFINSFINTILLSKSAEDIRFIMIDPKGVELSPYNGIKHLLYPVCEDMQKGLQLIEWCIEEIERRTKESKKKPYIVLVIDEFADLMLGDESTNSKLEKIAKDGSDVGIHMLLSSSKPTLTVFTPELKNAIHSRLVGAMASGSDSKELIEEESGIDLLGNGDMIFKDIKSGERLRVQTPFISTEDQEIILKSMSKVSEYKDIELKEIEEEIDPLFEEAKRLVIKSGKANASYLQRHLQIAYNRAARLIDQLEEEGVIGPQIDFEPREVLIDKNELQIEMKENRDFKKEGDILWLTKEHFKKALNMPNELPIKEIKLLPFLQKDIHTPDLSPYALIAGILKIYDIDDSKMIESIYGVDISKQKRWYREFLLTIGQEEPNEEFTEGLILGTLVRVTNYYGNDFVIPLYKNAIVLLPTSKIFCDYISTMLDYLYEHPEKRNDDIYRELQEMFKKIKREEVDERIWESMVLTNYCLTDLLGNDKSKALYLNDIKQENLVRAIKERSCFDILFGEEYV